MMMIVIMKIGHRICCSRSMLRMSPEIFTSQFTRSLKHLFADDMHAVLLQWSPRWLCCSVLWLHEFSRSTIVALQATASRRRQDLAAVVWFNATQHPSSWQIVWPSNWIRMSSSRIQWWRAFHWTLSHINARTRLTYHKRTFTSFVCAQFVVNSAVTSPPDWLQLSYIVIALRLLQCHPCSFAGVDISTSHNIFCR